MNFVAVELADILVAVRRGVGALPLPGILIPFAVVRFSRRECVPSNAMCLALRVLLALVGAADAREGRLLSGHIEGRALVQFVVLPLL